MPLVEFFSRYQRELREKFVQRNLLFPEILYVAVFLMMMDKESVVKCKITLMVNEKCLDITLEEVIMILSSYVRDLIISEQTEKELSGKKPKVGKAKVKYKEFEKCELEGKFFKCFKEGLDVMYKEFTKHNKNSKETVRVNVASIASKSYYLDYINACTATIDMSEEDRDEEAISYLESQDEDLQGVGVYKIGSVILVDSGAAFTSVIESIKLQNLKNVRGTRLEYADGSIEWRLRQKEM